MQPSTMHRPRSKDTKAVVLIQCAKQSIIILAIDMNNSRAAFSGDTTTAYFSLFPNEIRLVTLLPGLCGDPIRCRLTHSPLASKPRFKTLSYAWGSPKALCRISLNEIPFSITVNLELALRRLRQRSHPCVFWVDAICIYSHHF